MTKLPLRRRDAEGGTGRSLNGILGEPTGLAGAAVTVVTCLALSLALWSPLAQVATAIGGAVPAASCPRDASGVVAALCAMQVAARPMLGPLLLALVVFAFRGVLVALVGVAKRRVPAGIAPLLAAAVATVAFALAWSGSHSGRSTEFGVLPQIAFPALVGLCTYAFARWGRTLQAALAPFFWVRDRVSIGLRVILVVALPVALSFWLSSRAGVPRVALNEQVIVVFGVVVGFLLMTPKSGSKEPTS